MIAKISAVTRTRDAAKRGAATTAALVLLGGAAVGCGVEAGVDAPEATSENVAATSGALSVAAAAGAVAAPATTASPGVSKADLRANLSASAGSLAIEYATIDMVPEGYMRYGARAYADTYYFYLNVTNVGQANILDLGVTVHINAVGATSGYQFTGFTQRGYVYNPAAPDDTIPAHTTNGPDNHGVVVLLVPKGTFASCRSYQVILDVNHHSQRGAGVFDNDSATVRTPCDLNYGQGITEQTLGYPPPLELANKVPSTIVSGFTSGRPDGHLCSWCHYKNANGTIYKPQLLNQDESMSIGPNQVVDNGSRVWMNEGGWATGFVAVGYAQHTPALNDLFRKWVADGWPH